MSLIENRLYQQTPVSTDMLLLFVNTLSGSPGLANSEVYTGIIAHYQEPLYYYR